MNVALDAFQDREIVELAVDLREWMNVVVGLIGVDDVQWLSRLNAQNARGVFAALLVERDRVSRRFKHGPRQSALDEDEGVLELAVLHDHVVQEILSNAFRVAGHVELARRGNGAGEIDHAGDIALIARRLPMWAGGRGGFFLAASGAERQRQNQ